MHFSEIPHCLISFNTAVVYKCECYFYSSVSQEPSLYTVKAIAILDNDGERVVAKVPSELGHEDIVHALKLLLILVAKTLGYFSNKRIFDKEIKDAKWSRFTGTFFFQALIKA